MTIPIFNFVAQPIRIGTRKDFSHTIFDMDPIPSGDWLGARVERSEDRESISYRIAGDRWTFEGSISRDPKRTRRWTGPGLVGRVTPACAWLTRVDQHYRDGDRVSDDWTYAVAHDHWSQFEQDHGDCTWTSVACRSTEDFHRMREIACGSDGRATVYRLKDSVEIIGTVEDVALVKFAA